MTQITCVYLMNHPFHYLLLNVKGQEYFCMDYRNIKLHTDHILTQLAIEDLKSRNKKF